MAYKLICLSRSYFLQRDPQTFENYHDAVSAAGAALETVSQGDVIEVSAEDQVLLRIRCERAAGDQLASQMPRMSGLSGPISFRD